MLCSSITPPKRKCPLPSNVSQFDTLEDLVDKYKESCDLHRNWDKKRSIPETVFGDTRPDAPQCSDDPTDEQWGTFLSEVIINSHQARHYSNNDLKDIAEYLAANWNRKTFNDFEDLYDYVYSILVQSATNLNGKVNNQYALIIYDIALRLASRYGVWPKVYVYLNGSGSDKGARALGLDKFIKKSKRKTILRSEIINAYPELAALDAAQLEDFLCIFHNELNRFKRK